MSQKMSTLKQSTSYAVVLRADHEQFRVTLLDRELGKIRALFFGLVSPGMVVRVQLNTKTHLPHASLLEIMASPMALARSDIWWFHALLALIDTVVPLGSGIGPLYEQLLWLCYRDIPLDNQLQMRYGAKMITILGLQPAANQLCTVCTHALQRAPVGDLQYVELDAECAAQLGAWVIRQVEEHIGPSFFTLRVRDCEE